MDNEKKEAIIKKIFQILIEENLTIAESKNLLNFIRLHKLDSIYLTEKLEWQHLQVF